MLNIEEQKLRDFLVSKQKELSTRLEALEQESSRRDNPLSADFEEQATEREGEDVLNQQTNIARVELAEIKQAIDRLQAGTYGVCGECGDPIPLARLKVMPMAMYCTDCQEYVDKVENS